MRIAGDIFNILLFLTAVGGGFTVLSLLADRAPRFAPPLWFGVCGMAAYMVPLLAPGLYLVPREAHAWREGYSAVCAVWLCGAAFFALYNVVRTLLARRALRSYPVCGDERVTAIGTRCCKLVGLKKAPLVLFGTLDGPACAAGVFRPTVILNEAVIKRLSDKELAAVLCHEMTHIRRGHILLGRVYDWVCVLHWFNPLAWIARKEFAAQCELDCDRGALASLENEVTNGEYAGAMLRLLELTALPGSGRGPGPGATGFLLTKRRVAQIMTKPSKAKTAIMTAVLAALLAAVMLLSAALSRGYFYPYPAYSRGTEYSYAVEAYFFTL